MASFSMPARDTASAFADMRGNQVGIRVSSLAAARDWYVEKLNFRVVREAAFGDGKLAYLAPPNDDNFMIELLGDGAPPIEAPSYTDLGDSLRHAGYHHYCINVTDIEKTVAELRARQVTIVTEPFEPDGAGRKLAFFADPFGNLIELAQVIA